MRKLLRVFLAMLMLALLPCYAFAADNCYMGVRLEETLTIQLPRGLMVVHVDKGSPAEKAGLHNSDIITSVEGSSFYTHADFSAYFQSLSVGDKLSMEILRPVYKVKNNYTIDGSISWQRITATLTLTAPPKGTDTSIKAQVVLKNSKALNFRDKKGKVFSSIPKNATVTILEYLPNNQYAYVEYNGKKGYVSPDCLQQKLPQDVQSHLSMIDNLAGVKHTIGSLYPQEKFENNVWCYADTSGNSRSKVRAWDISMSYEYSMFHWENVPQAKTIRILNYLLRNKDDNGWNVYFWDTEKQVWISRWHDVLRANVVSEKEHVLSVQYAPMESVNSATAVGTAPAAATPAPSTNVKPSASAKPSVTPAKCSKCGGDGKISASCSKCGGDGKTTASCTVCDGDGSYKCGYCKGKGYEKCPRCSGGTNKCTYCRGTGYGVTGRCIQCKGAGVRICTYCDGKAIIDCDRCSSGQRRCNTCSGKGTVSKKCTTCSGKGKVTKACPQCK